MTARRPRVPARAFDGDRPSRAGRAGVQSARRALVLAQIAASAPPSIPLPGAAELVVYEQRSEGCSSDDGITLELGPTG